LEVEDDTINFPRFNQISKGSGAIPGGKLLRLTVKRQIPSHLWRWTYGQAPA
jgi:hypothetical protein